MGFTYAVISLLVCFILLMASYQFREAFCFLNVLFIVSYDK